MDMMISFKLAKQLKAAGLEWKPYFTDGGNAGDRFYWPSGDLDVVEHRDYYLAGHLHRPPFYSAPIRRLTFAPRLDQLLAEIERHGLSFDMGTSHELMKSKKYYFCVYYSPHGIRQFFDDDRLNEAAAGALLWILKKERADG